MKEDFNVSSVTKGEEFSILSISKGEVVITGIK